jgi:hypothetical protein
MWIFTPIGFFSVVAHRDIKKSVLVRARAKKDLETFRKRYCKRLGPITFLDWSDYPYRATVSRWAFAHAMFKIALDMTYTNFKSAVKEPKRHNVYMKVWTVMREAERNGNMGDKQAAERGRGKQYHTSYSSQSQRFFDWHGGGRWWEDDEDRGGNGKAKKGKKKGKGKKGKARPIPLPPAGRLDDVPALPDDPPDSQAEREEQMARDAGAFDDDLISDPFGWDDGLGSRGGSFEDDDPDGDAGLDRDELEETPLEFDSINDVINHFKRED